MKKAYLSMAMKVDEACSGKVNLVVLDLHATGYRFLSSTKIHVTASSGKTSHMQTFPLVIYNPLLPSMGVIILNCKG